MRATIEQHPPQHARQDVHLFVTILSPRPLDRTWLENEAMRLESTLVAHAQGLALGPSVAANFDRNGLELDVTVEAGSLSDAYSKLSRILGVVEEAADFELMPEGPRGVTATASSRP